MAVNGLQRLQSKLSEAFCAARDYAGKSRALKILQRLARHPGFYAACMALVAFLCANDYYFCAFARRTFWFYALDGGGAVIDERLLPRQPDLAEDAAQYVREFILGPIPENTAALFHPRTVLESLIVDGEAVYINLSEEAVLPVGGYNSRGISYNRETEPLDDEAAGSYNGDVLNHKVEALRAGLLANYPAIKRVTVFMGGYEFETG
ncbi:MAG: hypothetical protein LBG72_04210 [Spirochaetaceae bacterium]|jgi:hypothetical protein|nr:hypothetical protein [Spirochaetaceae bacterium]